MNILFTCAGRRRYLLEYFKKEINNDGKIIATDMQSTAPAFSAADIKIEVPGVYDKNYIPTLLSICKKHHVDILISLNDLELPILSQNKEKFEIIGVKLIVSDPEIIDICFDKYKSSKWIEQLGLKTPKTYFNIESTILAIESGFLKFPLIVKPRWGSGSIGLEFVDDIEELRMVYELYQKKIKKSILSTASGEDNYILIQDVIKGDEYGIDIINDFDGNNRGVCVKRKLAMRSGETDKAITINNPEIEKIGKTIGNSLHHIGNLDCDIIEQNGNYYVIELNPRFGGGYPFSHEAGVNVPKAIIEWAKGNDVNDDIFIPEYGKIYSKCDILINIDNLNVV